MILIELFVIPGFGIWGLSGMLLIGASLVMASQEFLIPENADQWSTTRNSVALLVGAFFVFVCIAGLITYRLGSLPFLNRILLKPPSASDVTSAALPEEADLVEVGDIGITDSLLRPAGKARFGEEVIDVVSDSNLIDPGTQVRVVKIQGKNGSG